MSPPAAASTDTPFSLRSIAVPAFGPPLLHSVAIGAIVPVIALTARELGASVAEAGVLAALPGIGTLLANLPAARLVSQHGERRAMLGAAVLGLGGLLLCLFAQHLLMLAAGVLLFGMASSVFMIARQLYLIEIVPVAMRARAMSTLGGTARIGAFAGPFLGAAAMHWLGLAGAYWVAAVFMVAVGVLVARLPDLPTDRPEEGVPRHSYGALLRQYRAVYLTLGLGVMLVSALRASRQVVLPLWAEHVGLDPVLTSVIYGVVALVDMSLFYPAGRIMDRHGRLWIALPCVLLLGGALMCLPLTHSVTTFVAVSMLIGAGNGIGSGIVMTLGADFAPAGNRAGFLGIWRLLSDVGNSAGPLLLAGVAATVSLGTGIVVIGMLGPLAAVMFWRWTPRQAKRE